MPSAAETFRPLRTWLFAPGNHPRKVEKVFQTGADAVILDLEDAVAIAEKEATRARVLKALKADQPCLGFIRVNALDTDFALGDLEAVVQPQVDGIVLPKVESPDDLVKTDEIITRLEKERGLPEGGIDLLPIIETALGVHNIDAIAQSGTRVKRLSFGAGDFTKDMGIKWSGEEQELIYPRSRFALASRVAGLEQPIDTVFIDLADDEHFEMSVRTALAFGFQGKLCIHPKQVPIVNGVFTPTDTELEQARAVIAAFDEAEASGSASIQVNGYFVDYPIVEKAQRVVKLADAIAELASC
ncbi:MAG: CoA ester lyase [Rhodospirillaceae bacterium]|nr:CoA ester lyase [Rhodospirillaceae bacterium]